MTNQTTYKIYFSDRRPGWRTRTPINWKHLMKLIGEMSAKDMEKIENISRNGKRQSAKMVEHWKGIAIARARRAREEA